MDNNNNQNFSNFSNYEGDQNYNNLSFSNFSLTPNYRNSEFFPNNTNTDLRSSYQTSQNSEHQNQLNLTQIQMSQYQYSNPNISRNLFNEAANNQTQAKSKPKAIAWKVNEDISLMSAWIFHGGDNIRGNNQKIDSIWNNVMDTFNEARRENPELFEERNKDMLKGRYKRLNTNAQKWVGAYNKAYLKRTSGMSEVDIEAMAQVFYQGDEPKKNNTKNGKPKNENLGKFNDLAVFKQVMRHSKKWETLPGSSCGGSRNVDLNIPSSGGSSKRSRENEDDEYSIPSNYNTDTPTSEHITDPTEYRPEGRNAAKKRRGKAKVTETSHNTKFTDEFREMRLTKEREIVSNEKTAQLYAEVENQRIIMEKQKNATTLMTNMMAKGFLTPEELPLYNKLAKYLADTY